MKSIVVVGAQWGDEGKGKVVDYMAASFEYVARCAGGHNAGRGGQEVPAVHGAFSRWVRSCRILPHRRPQCPCRAGFPCQEARAGSIIGKDLEPPVHGAASDP